MNNCNIENFDFDKLKELSLTEAKKYIDKYFIPLTNGEHAFLLNGEYEIMNNTTIKQTYFKRMISELQKYYFQEKTDLRTISYDVNKPTLYKGYLNLCPKIKHTYNKKYSEFSQETKNKVDFILKHIFEVYCSNKKDSYEHLLKWFSNMVRGNKNDSALYLRGPQGAGKSSILDEFIRYYVIGKDLTYLGGSEPLKNHFNSALSGKLLVLFEELESMSIKEWMSVSCVLKRQITSKTIQIERKGKEMRDETNLNNYAILSNTDAIQDDQGRRYFILDISTIRLGDKEYFKKLHSYFNDEVGYAFYCYLMEIDLKDYNAQSFPLTQSKLDSFSKRLDNVYKFIKEEYILKSQPLNKISVKQLFNKYEIYCISQHIKSKGKIEFKKTLEDVGIKCYKSDTCHKYNYTLEDLNKIAQKFHWIHELDLDVDDDDEEENESPFDNGIKTNDEPDYKKLYFELLNKLNTKEEPQPKKKELTEDELLELELLNLSK